MNSRRQRLSRIYAALTDSERMEVALTTLHAGRVPPPSLLSTMPRGQARRFDKTLRRVYRAHRVIGRRALVLDAHVETLEVRQALLSSLAAWGADRMQLVSGLLPLVAEPISESAHKGLVTAARAEHLPLGEAVALAAEELNKDPPEIEAELIRLCETGPISSRKAGRKTEVEKGSLYDWLEKDVPVAVGWARYEVVPDEQWETERLRADRLRLIEDDFLAGPGDPSEIFPVATEEPRVLESTWDSLARTQATRIKHELRDAWAELLVLEGVLPDLRVEPGGTSALPDRVLQVLTRVREVLERLLEDQRFTGPLALASVDADEVARLNAAIRGEPVR